MAEAIEVTQEDVQQAEALKSSLGDRRLEAAAVDICAAWRRVERYWPWILTAVRKIPRIGEAIAMALELIGNFLKAHCEKA